LHLNLDDAWRDEPLNLPALDAHEWGLRLRFCAPPRLVEKFYRELLSRIEPFTLYGSGDFHYLSALWLRRLTQPVVLVSFDNHPDWDIRPPKWACGGWINRTLEASAEPADVPWAWRQYAHRGYLLLQALDSSLLEPQMPASIFYNLMLSARKRGSV